MIVSARVLSLIALARILNTTFFFATAVYALLAYSPFTYAQFIKPNVSAALTAFAIWHGHIHLFALSITALTLAPFLERSSDPWARRLGWSYLAASVLFGGWLFMEPLWMAAGTSRANLALAVIAAIPPIWLAWFDHAALRSPAELTPSDVGRTWSACWMAAAFVFAVYAVAAPIRLRLTGGIALSTGGIILGWTLSALSHLTAFTLIYLVAIATGACAALVARGRADGAIEYRFLWAVSSAALALVLLRVMLAPIAVRGPAAWIVSTSTAVALASAWAGIARILLTARRAGPLPAPLTALDAWMAPLALPGSIVATTLALTIGPVAVQLIIDRVATYDWEFMLQKLLTLTLWVAVFALIQGLTTRRRWDRGAWKTAAPAAAVIAVFAVAQFLVPRLPALIGNPPIDPDFALDGYASLDPSFRIARDMLESRTTGEAAELFGYLRGQSGIESTGIEPVNIDFASVWTHDDENPPHIFLFIIDSLRRDYVAPYNPAVGFTPALAAFAADSFVFRRAFSRYAGTGLAVPSIWAGSMLIHKQYVTPFAAMNALEKLVMAKGYRQVITEDHITAELFSASPDIVAMDRGVPEMLHTFCRTMGELRLHLEKPDASPVFAHTRPLDLHIGNIASAKVPEGESYPGFYEPYAARVRQIDRCFGEFVETLKTTGLYDNSIIVITSDHGDSLGEAQRWGHGFTAFPEVLRIPLIIHLPEAHRARVSANLGQAAFSTDITPTLYQLLGEASAPETSRGTRDLLKGSPLFVDPSADLSWRRRESYLVASSYGPVFGLIGRNGRRLYLADGVESREYSYELRPDGTNVRISVTDAERQASRRAIGQQVAELAAWYGFTPER